MTKTEKLRREIARRIDKEHPDQIKYTLSPNELSYGILKACKEAGLKFTTAPIVKNYPHSIESIEVE